MGYAFVGAVNSGYLDPTTYKQAMERDDNLEWAKTINKEVKTMEEKGVWKIIKQADVPSDRTLLSSKWVFKKKRTDNTVHDWWLKVIIKC